MTKEEKPMLDTDGQIRHLQSKGIKFIKVTVGEATTYLRENNNYFKLRAYRKNFPKHPDGEHKGEYIDLDFAALKDLSIIDMRMRYTFIQMALDIEHFAKVHLLAAIENSGGDGYAIVEDYFNELKSQDALDSKNRYDNLCNEINRNKGNSYCGGIIAKYNGCYPAWAFVEIASLGTLIHFYGFCADQLDDTDLKDGFFLMMTIKELRNATAHSNCLIHDMGAKDSTHKPNYGILRALNGISRATKDNQLKNERMRQIITLLYAHKIFVSSVGVHEHTKDNLDELVSRMYHHIDFYDGNENVLTSFSFFKKAVDIFFV